MSISRDAGTGSTGKGKTAMTDRVQVCSQRVRDHARRTHNPERKLNYTEVGSAVNRTLPRSVISLWSTAQADSSVDAQVIA
jgi:hypothetical protein